MIAISNDAILLSVEEKSFKGRDGKNVNFVQAKVLDDDNDLHLCTVSSEIDLSEVAPRSYGSAKIEFTEVDGRLKKRLISFDD